VSQTPRPKLAFETPGKDAPGFLKRQMRGLSVLRAFRAMQRRSAALTKQGVPTTDDRWAEIGEETLTVLEDLIGFMLTCVTEPADKDAARALIEDLSENELMELMPQLLGGSDDAPLAPPSSDSKLPGS